MNYEPSLLLGAVVLLAVFLAGVLLGVAFARFYAWHGFRQGYEAGRTDELSHTNAIVIRARREEYRKGVTAGSCRMWHLVAKEKTELT